MVSESLPSAAKEMLLSTRAFLSTFTLQRSHASTCRPWLCYLCIHSYSCAMAGVHEKTLQELQQESYILGLFLVWRCLHAKWRVRACYAST